MTTFNTIILIALTILICGQFVVTAFTHRPKLTALFFCEMIAFGYIGKILMG